MEAGGHSGQIYLFGHEKGIWDDFFDTCKGWVESIEGVQDVPACHMGRQARARKL